MRRLFTIVFSVALLAIGSAQGTWAQQPNFYELGTYPGGTWFTTQSVNELGVVVGRGDVPSGYIHTLAVPLFGPYAGQWIDLGALGGVQPTGFEYEAFTSISDTPGWSSVTPPQVMGMSTLWRGPGRPAWLIWGLLRIRATQRTQPTN